MRRVSTVNFKGGTGKSSLVQNLADAFVRELNKTVLIIDGDRQSNTTTTLLGKRVFPNLTDVLTDSKVGLGDVIYEARTNLYVIPSDGNLDRANVYIKEHPRTYYKIRDSLLQLEGKGIDIIFIDHAGAYSTVMAALLEACTEMIIPCELEPYAVTGLRDMFDKLSTELEGHTLRNAGIVPYNTDFSKLMTSAYLQELNTAFGTLVTPAVRTDTAVSYAQSKGMTVFEYEKEVKRKSGAAEDFRKLAHHFNKEEEKA